MILTDREIQTFLAHKQILIKPAPILERYSSTSVDLTLSSKITVFQFDQIERLQGEVVTLGESFDYKKFKVQFTKTKRIPDGYAIPPQHFILAWTSENVSLPNHSRIAARIEGKSSLARLGLGIHVTAPTIHAGFDGPLQLEMCNHGPVSLKIVPGMPICQLIFELTLGTPRKGYTGQFQRQKG